MPDADGKPYEAAPWRLRSVFNSDGARSDTIPTTNVVRKYNFTVHRGLLSPDGILKDAIMVNGQHPGPTIEANWGDWIEIDVHNDIASPAEGTAIHAHGMLQKGTGWADGVSGITQCPIAPGQSFTYRFRAEVHGSSFWHAHYSSQYTAGIIGPIVIHGPSVQPYDIDVGPVMLSDLNHIPYFAIVSDVVGLNASFIPASSDTLMLNGRNSWNCHNTDKSFHHGSELLGSGDDSTLTDRCKSDAPLSNFTFQAGKTHRLRLINHAADIVHKVSIDGLSMTVIAQDFVPVQPYTADVVTIGVAQRTDVLVTAPSDPKAAYWMRSVAASGPSCGHSKYGLVKAAIFNHEADTNIYPTTKETRNLDTESCTNDLTLPVPAFQITPTKPSYVQDVVIALGKNETGHTVFGINNSTYRANFNDPILRYASQGQTTFPDHPEWNVYDYGSNTSIVFNITNPTPITHPFHLHLANMYILASGPGVWDGSVAVPGNPTRRDTWMVPPHGHSVFQIESENPGVFPLHCKFNSFHPHPCHHPVITPRGKGRGIIEADH